MLGRALGLLSADEGLRHIVEDVASEVEVESLFCLASADSRRDFLWLVIDPRSAGRCCLDVLAGWKRNRQHRRVIFLTLSADPEILLLLPLCYPGKVVRPSELPHLLSEEIRQAPASPSEAREAWKSRDLILSPDGLREKPRLFLGLAGGQDRGGLTVGQAASAVGLSPRQLERLSRKTFGVAPKLLLKLGRMSRLLEALLVKKGSLEDIAEQAGFPDQSALSRFVTRFMGLRPGAYRGARCRKLT